MSVVLDRRGEHDRAATRLPDLAALALGVAAPTLYAATVIWGGTLVPGYSHMSDFISSLVQSGRTGTESVQWLFLAYNCMVLIFATYCLRRLSQSREWTLTFILLFAVAASGILMAPFPQDPVGDPITASGLAHIVLAGLASLGCMGAIWFSGWAWRRAQNGEDLATFSFVCVGIVFLSGLLSAAAAVGGWTLAGLFERLTIGTFLLWVLVTAAVLLRRLVLHGVALSHLHN